MVSDISMYDIQNSNKISSSKRQSNGTMVPISKYSKPNQWELINSFNNSRSPDNIICCLYCFHWRKVSFSGARESALISKFRATPNEPIDRSNKIKFVQSMSLGYFLQDFAVLVHTRELGGTYQLLFHHSSAVFAYLLGMVSSLFTINS